MVSSTGDETNKLQSLWLRISNIISPHSPPAFIEEEIQNALNDIGNFFNSDAVFYTLTYTLSTGGMNKKYQRSVGKAIEQCEYLISLLTSEMKSHIPSPYEFTIYTNLQSRQFESIHQIIKIEIHTVFVGTMWIYLDQQQTYQNNTFQEIAILLKVFQNAVEYSISRELEKMERSMQKIAFEKNSVPILVINEDYNIVSANDIAKSIFGDPSVISPLHLLSFFDTADEIDKFKSQLQDLSTKNKIEVFNVKFRQSAYSMLPISSLTYDLYISKHITGNKNYYVITAPLHEKPIANLPSAPASVPLETGVYHLIEEFAEIYRTNLDKAIDQALEHLFLAAFAFVVNEQMGPTIVSTSPSVNHDMVFEESIRLLAGLNTNQILKHGYLSGTTPWTHPTGELRWIAFSIHNEKARGNTEIHLIGVVTASNLLMVKPEISQVLYGLLLGGMNSYLESIIEDQVDFCTEPFNPSKYYSTISIIENHLLELRKSSAELLAAYAK